MRKTVVVLALGTLMEVGMSGATIVVDNFATFQNLTVAAGGINPVTNSGGVVTGVNSLGGARFASLTRTSGAGSDTLDFDNGGSGLMEFSSGANDGAIAVLLFDGGTDANNDFGLNDDLTGGGLIDRFRVSVRSDLVAPITIRVYQDALNFSTATFNLPGGGFALPFTVTELLFSSFLPSGAGATFTNAKALTLTLNGSGQPGLDVQMDFLLAETPGGDTEVPEVSTLFLIGGGLLFLPLAARRAKA